MDRNNLTKEQNQAIDTLSGNILVSAAAGSGKTTVLIKRIINIILQGEAEVTEMLVVTFTNAAAAEMKAKLSKAIQKEIAEDPSSAPRLYRQLDRMVTADISTLDHFAGTVVREFFYKVGADPDYSICDDIRAKIFKQEAMEALFNYMFDHDGAIEGGSFRNFLEHYSSDRNERGIISDMTKFYDKLRSMPDYFGWAEEKAELLNITEENYRDSALYSMIEDDVSLRMTAAVDKAGKFINMIDSSTMPNTYAKFEPECMALIDIGKDLANGKVNLGDEFFDAITAIEYPRFVNGAKEKEAFNEIKDELKLLRDSYKSDMVDMATEFAMPSFDVRMKETASTYAYTRYYISLLREFEKRYDAIKREKHLMDFGDVEHMAYRILKDKEVSGILKERYKYIFIDEYQDTNYLQESLISQVARGDNVFKVGDIKQSIYRFRQAEPQIFIDTHAKYADQPGSKNIDLNKNFRCNKKTIRYINDVFSALMPGYDDKAALNPGLATNEEYDFEPEIHTVYADSDEGQKDEEEAGRTRDEMEAGYAADIVADILGKDFYDSKSKIVRRAEPRDVVILMRSTRSTGGMYYRALLHNGIPSHINDEEGYFDTIEVNTMLAMMNVIDNSKQDVPLIALLRSDVFGFTPSELAEIRVAYNEEVGKGSYWKAFDHCVNMGKGDIHEKAAAVRETIMRWRRMEGLMPLEEYLWYLLSDSGYYMYAGAMYGGDQRQANLRTLTERARIFREGTVSSLTDFIGYLNVLKASDVKSGQTSMVGSEDNVVRIMTIHKSKGLEFPFVIIAGLNRKLNYTASSKGMIMDAHIGLGLAYVDRKRKAYRQSLMQHLILQRINREEYEENLRVLYVAMTRAQNKLIMLGIFRNNDELLKINDASSAVSPYLKIMKDILDLPSCKRISAPATGSAKLVLRRKFRDFAKKWSNGEILPALQQRQEIDRRLSYKYSYFDDLTMKAKYSVSELQRIRLGNNLQRFGKVGNRISSGNIGNGSSAAEIGTAYHRLMEFTDFTLAVDDDGIVDEKYINERLSSLIDSGSIKDVTAKHIECEKIFDFFHSDIGIRAANAARHGRLRKEKNFTLASEFNRKRVLVQGVIDCIFTEGNKIVIIDYKSNRINRDKEAKEAVTDIYKEQIRIYCKAAEAGMGLEVREAYLYLFDTSELVDMMAKI